MSALLELAERCEAAAGPDSEISAAIHKLRGFPEWDTYCPHYTASLDAAMTLLDESWFFHVSRFSPDEGGGQAHVYPNRGLGDDYEADAATPALALCAAALRARAASAIETESGDVQQAPSRSDESATRQGDAQS